MHISPTTAPVPQHTPEPPRPAQHETQASSRPVIGPTQNEATAQETRRQDEQRTHREGDKHAAGHPQQSSSGAEAHPKPQAASGSHRHSDPIIGSTLDVFA